MDWSAYEERLFVNGNSQRQRSVNRSRAKFERDINKDPSYKNVEIIRDDKVVGSVSLRMDNRKIKNDAPQMDIHDKLDSPIKFTYGDVFRTMEIEEDNAKESYWLCIDEDNFHGIQRDGIVEECNYYLPFQNKQTLELHGRWCSVRSPYSSGVDEGKTISTGNAKFDITLPYDEETKLFHRDYRFIIDYANNKPIPYKIIRFDGVTNRYTSRQEGFLTIKVEEDQVQDDDNWELGIANYKPPSDDRLPGMEICEILYSGDPIIVSGGSAKKFTAVFYDDDKNPVTTIVPVWELILPLELQHSDKIGILSQVGNEIKLEARSNADIGLEFSLKLSGNDDVYGYFECEQRIKIGGVW